MATARERVLKCSEKMKGSFRLESRKGRRGKRGERDLRAQRADARRKPLASQKSDPVTGGCPEMVATTGMIPMILRKETEDESSVQARAKRETPPRL